MQKIKEVKYKCNDGADKLRVTISVFQVNKDFRSGQVVIGNKQIRAKFFFDEVYYQRLINSIDRKKNCSIKNAIKNIPDHYIYNIKGK